MLHVAIFIYPPIGSHESSSTIMKKIALFGNCFWREHSESTFNRTSYQLSFEIVSNTPHVNSLMFILTYQLNKLQCVLVIITSFVRC